MKMFYALATCIIRYRSGGLDKEISIGCLATENVSDVADHFKKYAHEDTEILSAEIIPDDAE